MRLHRLGFALMIAAAASTVTARPDRNAFLNQKATSAGALVAQAKKDPQVRDRYKRHFAMSDEEVIAYLSSLRVARLAQDGVYTVYSVPPGEWIKMRYEALPQGTPVYADSSGAAVMLMKCGNPLTRGPKDVTARSEDLAETESAPTMTLREVVVDANAPVSTDLLALVPSSPQLPPEEFATIDQSPVTIIPGAFGFNPLLLGLGGFGLLLDDDDDVQQEVVPEPASLASLAIGFVALMRLTRRRRKSRLT